MFTYKAVEQNSEAIACDIARNLYGGEVQDAPEGSHVPCVVDGEGDAPQGIVLISGDSRLVEDFQIWRADIAAMDSLSARAETVCGGAKAGNSGAQSEGQEPERENHARGLGSTALGLMSSTPPGQMIAGAGAVLGMFSSDQSVSSVVGTVQDPALMNEVARQLRALKIRVVIPELYSPNGLSGPDASHSPYLRSLNQLTTEYDACLGAKGGNQQEIAGVTGEIKEFLAAVMGAASQPKPSGGGGAGGGAGGSGASDGGAGGSGGSAAASSSVPHFAAALKADAVAQKLGISDEPGAAANKIWQHLLWVKALESGGSVTRMSNLFGTRVRFGGGAVDTFAVFRLDGDLVCSGNAYSFQSPVRLKDLDKKYNEAPKRGPAEFAMLRSTCSMLPSP
jgi:hypothetical protein